MREKPAQPRREYIGCLHIHTSHGVGSERFAQVVKAAIEARLDFIVITDRNTLRGLRVGVEGCYDRTSVLVGEEVAGEGGHCLALGTREEIGDQRDDPKAVLEEIGRQSGVSIIAHPNGSKDPLERDDSPAWSDWSAERPDALALWTFLDDWRSGVTRWNRRRRLRRPSQHLSGPAPETIAKWDELLRDGPMSAVAALDAQGPRRGMRDFTYRDLFDTIRMHLLIPPFTRRFFEDKTSILDALRSGQGFIANDALASAEGFRFEVHCADGEIIPMGRPTPFASGMTLRARLPRSASVRLISDGQAWFTKDDVTTMDLELSGPATIRLEVTLGDSPWIFSNPVYLTREP